MTAGIAKASRLTISGEQDRPEFLRTSTLQTKTSACASPRPTPTRFRALVWDRLRRRSRARYGGSISPSLTHIGSAKPGAYSSPSAPLVSSRTAARFFLEFQDRRQFARRPAFGGRLIGPHASRPARAPARLVERQLPVSTECRTRAQGTGDDGRAAAARGKLGNRGQGRFRVIAPHQAKASAHNPSSSLSTTPP